MQRKLVLILIMALICGYTSYAQQDKLKTLPLDDLSSFRTQAGNWRIVGDVSMDPTIDIHNPETPPVPAEQPSRKSKKSRTPAVSVEPRHAVTFTEGKGVLLNINDNSKKDNIISILEHGDIELELDVMLPKGSNSGLYLQGRYELQLFDSWGVKSPKFSDMGGIYRNWENAPDKIYMGKAPLTNAAKAPGLWQHLKISFRAPRFDNAGNKIENARLTYVFLNGALIHQNVELPKPTGGPVENNEKSTGPLLIQGDHGPVAIRNVRYKLIKELQYTLGNISYDVFHGNFKSTSEFASAKPITSGKAAELGVDIVDVEDKYGVRLRGDITVPEDSRYQFRMVYTGGAKFILNNQEVFNYPTPDGWRNDTASINLKAGTYPFEILNFKDASWMPPRLAVFVTTPTSISKALHSSSSYPPDDAPPSSIFVNAGKEPRILRAFMDYKGNSRHRLTHTIGVGDPTGLNYVFDLKSGNLVCVWRGDFVDATPMWHDRGDGSFRPLGAPLFLTNNQALAYLNSPNDAFPSAAKEGDMRGKGFSIEEESGRPIFKYQYQGLEIEDKVFPAEENKILTHEIRIKAGVAKDGLYYKLGEGNSIVQMPDGRYAINDKEYYIKVQSDAKPFIRDVNGKKELIAPVAQSIQYSVIW
jgi:hypothetical protein